MSILGGNSATDVHDVAERCAAAEVELEVLEDVEFVQAAPELEDVDECLAAAEVELEVLQILQRSQAYVCPNCKLLGKLSGTHSQLHRRQISNLAAKFSVESS